MRTGPSRSPGRATCSATASSPRPRRFGRGGRAARLYSRQPVDVQLARQHWEDGVRRVERTRSDPALYERLQAQVEVVTAELRRRIGLTFTLADLARAYEGADQWAREALGEARDEDAPVPETATVSDAAFHFYSR